MAYSMWRNSRQTAALRGAAVSVRELGRLSEQLATADDRERMIATILERAGTMVGARQVSVALWSGDDTALLSRSSDRSDVSGWGGSEVPVERDDLGPLADALHPVVVTPDLSSPIGTALVTDAPVLLGDAAAVRATFPAGWEGSGPDPASAVALVLRRPNGRSLGAIEWVWARGRELTPATRSTLLTVAEVCEQSLFRAEVHHGRWRAASALASLSQGLSVARTLTEIAELVVRFGPGASGAHHVAVAFTNESLTELTVHHAVVGEDGVVQDPAVAGTSTFSMHIDPNGPLTSMLRRGQPIQLDGMSVFQDVPEVVALIGGRLERTTGIPLIDAEGRLRGAIAFIHLRGISDPREPVYAEAGRLDTIADLTAQTVERSLLYQHEHELVVNLQQQTLGALPAVDGLCCAARYLPSSSMLGLGGDWYDVYPLDDGGAAVMVGDVAGHGIDAIADMAEFRTTISTLLRTRSDLSELAALSTSLLAEPGGELRFATVGLMVIDPSRRRLSYIRCGHPPALMCRPDGSVELLDQAGGAPIGIERRSLSAASVAFEPGTVLLAYTDGLIERRDEVLDTGIERLRSALAECPTTDPVAIVDHVIARCLAGRSTEDDTAVLVIRVD
ncbi:MAG TPA: PP2C family protein-serine/threonine phosphatase [Ilumatobacteraceae bacterium]|nr:PP2C family protein-serine/threonine phosphatase [Ilumatobacteraceae bacterium]